MGIPAWGNRARRLGGSLGILTSRPDRRDPHSAIASGRHAGAVPGLGSRPGNPGSWSAVLPLSARNAPNWSEGAIATNAGLAFPASRDTAPPAPLVDRANRLVPAAPLARGRGSPG